MEILKKKKKKTKKQNSVEMYYDTAELVKLRYIKLIYTGLDDKQYEISTEVKFIGDVLISLYFRYSEDFNINYPQEVKLKFVTTDALYVATAVLQEIKKVDSYVYFSVLPPTRMVRIQNRKYVRVNLDRTCIMVVTDENGISTTYLTKSLNLSACGILLHNLETMNSDEIIEEDMNFSKYDCYNIVIFLEPNVVLKLFARYVRHEYVNDSHRYAFQFLNMKAKNIDAIFKCVTTEQLKILKLQMRYK